MSFEDYPEEVELVETNFKTDQQQAAAEMIVEEWPVDLDTLVEEGDHVRVFYQRVIEGFIGPAGTDMTFDEIESEYGSVAEWREQGADAAEDSDAVAELAESASDEGDTIEGSDVLSEDDLADLGAPDGDDEQPDPDVATSSDDGATAATAAPVPDDPPAEEAGEQAVDERRREWFAAGFREGITFALENPDLVKDR